MIDLSVKNLNLSAEEALLQEMLIEYVSKSRDFKNLEKEVNELKQQLFPLLQSEQTYFLDENLTLVMKKSLRKNKVFNVEKLENFFKENDIPFDFSQFYDVKEVAVESLRMLKNE